MTKIPSFVPVSSAKQRRAFVAIYGVAIAFWLTLVVWREHHQRDVEWMRRTYIDGVPVVGPVNGWAVGHFLNYMALGFFAPDMWPYAVLAGVAFEVAEIPMGAFVSSYIDSRLVEDTVTNVSGLALGLALRRALKV